MIFTTISHVYPAKTLVPSEDSESSLGARDIAKDHRLSSVGSDDLSEWTDAQVDLSLRWEHKLCEV